MNKNLNIFIIIVTYQGQKWYDRSIGEWFSGNIDNLNVNVVVVDNSPTEDDANYIKGKYPKVHVIRTGENLGFAKANNLGLRYALDHGADYVLLLNHDAWFRKPSDLAEMIRISEAHPEYWILSPLQVYASSGRIERETERHLERSSTSKYDWLTDAYRGTLQDVYPSEYSCAFCWLLPIATVKKIGGFDPLFYHYGEDDNYQQRVRYHGGKVGMCAKVEVCHDIEDRPASFRDKNLDWRKYLIIRYCDINMKGWRVESHLKSLRKKLFFMCLRLQRKHIRETLPEYRYLKSKSKEITESRNVNREGGACWLE